MSQTSDHEQPDPTSVPDPEPKRGLFARLFRKASNTLPDDAYPVVFCEPGCAGHPMAEWQAVQALMRQQPPKALFAALIGPQPTAPEQQQAPAVKREWSPMFADAIKPGDLIGLSAGMLGPEREVKVEKIREVEREDDPESPYLALLLVDQGTGDVFSPVVSRHQAFRVVPAVPDSPAGLGGGV